MIKIEKIKVEGWEPAIRGMRNPLDSWEKSDSIFCDNVDNHYCIVNYHNLNNDVFKESAYAMSYWNMPDGDIGPNDRDLMMKLAKSGTEHAKYRRMIVVWMDITAPLYWWKEFDTYKVGTVADSCSTMHTIHKKEFTLDDFSCEHLGYYNPETDQYEIVPPIPAVEGMPNVYTATNQLEDVVYTLNFYRNRYLETKDKKYWWQLIQLLPSSYNQKRTVMLNYEVLANIYRQRRNHKLDEWHVFCDMIEKQLPYSQIITFKGEMEKELAEDLRNDGVPEEDIPGAVEHIKWFLTPPDRDKMANDVCDLVINPKIVEENKAYLEKQRKILQKNYDDAIAKGKTWISVEDLMKDSMFECIGNTDITAGFDLSAGTDVQNVVNVKRLADITASYIEADLKEEE